MRILVLNPNSSTDVTAAMDGALDLLRRDGGPEIVTRTLEEGPRGIETQEQVESVVLPVAHYFAAHPADAYVIGCFSDPGLVVSRENLSQPVFGMAESAFRTAVGIGERFGIVAIKSTSIGRHMRTVRGLGLMDRLAADRALEIGVADMLETERVLDRVEEVGRVLRDEDGADVLVLGCASMGLYRPEIEKRLGLPVVDPVQAAVARAIAHVSLGYRKTA